LILFSHVYVVQALKEWIESSGSGLTSFHMDTMFTNWRVMQNSELVTKRKCNALDGP